MNKAYLIGRMGKDIDIRTTQSQHTVGRFSLAVSRKKKDETDWISCIAFDKVAELIQKYVSKGHRLGVVGHIQTGSYEKDGRKIYTTDVIVDEIEFLEAKSEPASEQTSDFTPVADDDLPFN